ncbi:TPA: hypothetical protein N0F65_012749 [Lagenidium giganteum]|uniref:Protein RER1 n=1 Tax=Lagenidium giganteum TaxID=4803 RepID=A0AAV2YIG3_9STRA|nr:TPA: hypothetical protein N0F65_012749 [Lagenidium giganteum]
METTRPYALYEPPAGVPLKWAAHVRLTPELLEKLQQQQVQLTLQVGGVHGRNKKNGVLVVHSNGADDEEAEQYELLTFAEDPRVNHVCEFQRGSREQPDASGYSIHKTGVIQQKLMVQRILSTTEKTRVKDRQARSVRESRARSSKMLDEQPSTERKRQRTTFMSRSSSRDTAVEESKPSLVLPSALTTEMAGQIREIIEAGRPSESEEAPDVDNNDVTVKKVNKPETHEPSLFSSEDEGDGDTLGGATKEQEQHPQKEESKETRSNAPDESCAFLNETTLIMPDAGVPSPKTIATNKQKETIVEVSASPKAITSNQQKETKLDVSASPNVTTTKKQTSPKTADSVRSDEKEASKADAPFSQREEIEKIRKSVSASKSRAVLAPERKRARPRTKKQLPDISFLEPKVQEICKNLVSHIPRKAFSKCESSVTHCTAILDEDDHLKFIEQHEASLRDWELLDKAYSIEIIRTEGCELQRELAADPAKQQEWDAWIENAHKKKELCYLTRIIASLTSRPQRAPRGRKRRKMQTTGDASSIVEPPFIARVTASIGRKWQHFLDRSTIHVTARWVTALLLIALYLYRVFVLNAFHIVTYGLGIYLLNLFIGFLSPQIDADNDGPMLPSKQSEEFRPFQRRVPEFQFWYSTSKATVISLLMTLSSAFDVPVFWPILLVYFIALFTLTMKRQIQHMWKHNYVPWSHGKQVYKGKAAKSNK